VLAALIFACVIFTMVTDITAIPTAAGQKLAVGLGSNAVSPSGLFAAAFVGLAITGFTAAAGCAR
jgi:hypothetical protein